MTCTTSNRDMQKGKEFVMKKQDNDSLIQELTKRLDWYMMEASEEEFDADQVQALMKLLDSLKTEEDKINVEEELPVEEAVSDFWKYCGEREEEEKLLHDSEPHFEEKEERKEDHKENRKDGKVHKVLWFFHRHRVAVSAAVILVVIMLGGSWQAVANAEKHGGFFWWMDKSEEGTTMITSPEGTVEDFDNCELERYDSIEEVPERYRNYVEQVCEIQAISEYDFSYSQVLRGYHKDKMYVYMVKDKSTICFEIIIYPQKILRVRETYIGYTFERQFEDGGIVFDVLSKEEKLGENKHLIYFYFGKAQYVVISEFDEKDLQNIVVEYKNVVTKLQ